MHQDSNFDSWLFTVPATRRQIQIAVAVLIALLVGVGLSVPFAEIPLTRIDAFIPTFEGAVILTDLITSVLLFSHCFMSRSRALLALASGYLFTSLVVVSHVLTFPGAFSPTGLLGAGPQTAGWLYFLWHFGFAIAVVAYACLKHDTPDLKTRATFSSSNALSLSVAIVIGLACAFTLLVTAGERLLPAVFLDQINLAPLARYILTLNALVCATALLLLWRKRPRSALDLWVMVVTLALICELITNSILISARFTFGWYVSRVFAIGTSTIVLAALLQENISMYGRLARSHATLLRERNSKLLNLEALAGAIKHELAQPLATAQLEAETLKLLVEQTPPDQKEASLVSDHVITAIRRATKVVDDIRDLFGKNERKPAPVNVNDVVLEALQNLDRELKFHKIVRRVELMSGLSEISGQRGQLQELVLNVIQNAIDAMKAANLDRRELLVKTEGDGHAVKITIADTGPGLDAKKDEIFEPFFTTKPNGVGLGLAISRMIIDQHGGQISVSPGKRRGTIFEITLPHSAAPIGPADPLQTARWLGKVREFS
jgi:signal transduction histidine kinase